ncbi:MAG: TfoX/Sxy family protein [Dehalococcoidia bacterium]
MAEPRSRASAAGAATAEALVDALQPFGAVSARRMFGGWGVFESGTMFALVDREGDAYLRADEALIVALEAEGSTRFQRMPYWSVPADALDDDVALLDWATRALAVARAAKRS